MFVKVRELSTMFVNQSDIFDFIVLRLYLWFVNG